MIKERMKITVYTKAGDPYSDMLKNLLKYYEIKHEIIEISRNEEKLRIVQEISGQYNTPVLKIDEKVFVGFDREKIKEVLGIKN